MLTRLTFDVSRWRPWRHFMQKSAAIWGVHNEHAASASCPL